MTMHEIADELSQLLGRHVIYAERTLEQQREVLLAEGLPAYVADLLVGLDQVFRDSAMSERFAEAGLDPEAQHTIPHIPLRMPLLRRGHGMPPPRTPAATA